MGCSEMTFEQEVRDDVMKEMDRLKVPPQKKIEFLNKIGYDLKHKNAAFDSYHYQYKEDDKKKVLDEYIEMLKKELNVPQNNNNNQNPPSNP